MPIPAKPRTKAGARAATAKPATKTAAKRPKAARSAPTKPSARSASKAKVKSGSKQSSLIAALQSAAGSTIAQLTKLTGWQPHTVRGVISGTLRKRLGLNVTSASEGEGSARTYRIVAGHAS